MRTGAACEVLAGHSDVISSPAFSPNGLLLASALLDATVKIWCPATGVEHATLQGHADGVSNVTFLPDNLFLASAGYEGRVCFWNAKTLRVKRTVELSATEVWDTGIIARLVLSFSSSGLLLAAETRRGSVRLWNAATGAVIGTLPNVYSVSSAL